MSNEAIKLKIGNHSFIFRKNHLVYIKTVQHFLDLHITMFYFDRFMLAILAFMKMADY